VIETSNRTLNLEKFIGLVRVSTEKQEESGLGIKAGHVDLNTYVEALGAELITTLEEVESGGHDNIIDRPTLLRALTLCKRHKATLLIPKVDRLVRSTLVHADIKRSGVPFRAVDNPHANEFTLDILVACAAQERRAAQDRTRKALAVYKAEKRVSKRVRDKYDGQVPAEVVAALGGKLGADLVGCHLTAAGREKGRAKGNAKQVREAVAVYEDLIPEMKAWRAEGLSLRAIAARLNERGDRTRTGTLFSSFQIFKCLERVA
jgi:DNA invertase Pin-like site-specific DNA recombinase